MARKFLSIEESYKNNAESSKQNKQDLLDKVKKMQGKNKGKSNEITFNNTPAKEKSELEDKLKKEVKRLESKLEDTKEELAASNKSNRELINEQKKFKTEIFDLKQEIKDLKLTLSYTGDLQLEIDNLKRKIVGFEEAAEAEKLKLEKASNSVRNAENSRHSIKQNYDKVNEQLKQERKTNGTLSDKVFKLNNALKHLAYKLSESDKELKEVKEQLGLSNIDVNVSYLLDNFERIDSKQFKNLLNITEALREKFEAKKVKTLISNAPEAPPLDIRMGYISKKDSIWWFYDLSDNEFRLSDELFDVESNTPAKVRIDGAYATLISTYKYNKIARPISINRRKKIEVEKNKIGFMQLEPCNVLLVGSRNMANYISRLKMHGIDAMWHNPFEESERRLASKYKSADLVLVFEQHISHGVWDIVDKKDPKVQSLKKDNANIIVSRVLFHQKQKTSQIT